MDLPPSDGSLGTTESSLDWTNLVKLGDIKFSSGNDGDGGEMQPPTIHPQTPAPNDKKRKRGEESGVDNNTTTTTNSTKKPRMMTPDSSGSDTSAINNSDAGLVPFAVGIMHLGCIQVKDNDGRPKLDTLPKTDDKTDGGRSTPNQNLDSDEEGARAGANQSPDGADHSSAELVPAVERICEEMQNCQLED